jgi:hypothetical protein
MLQWLQRLSGAVGPSGSRLALTAPDVMATTNKEAVDKRAAEEAAMTRATEKAVADKEAVDKSTVDEVAVTGAAVGAVRDSPASGQTPSLLAWTKRVVAPSGTTPSAKRPGAFGNLGLSSPLSLF